LAFGIDCGLLGLAMGYLISTNEPEELPHELEALNSEVRGCAAGATWPKLP
jgi:hypothetical protein